MNTVSNSLRLRSRSCLRTAALARQSARSNGEPPPPLEESALEYRPSVAGSIPAHKAVTALAASLLGLVGTLGHKAPPMANGRPTKRRPALDGAQHNYTSPQVGGQTERRSRTRQRRPCGQAVGEAVAGVVLQHQLNVGPGLAEVYRLQEHVGVARGGFLPAQ